jgi:transposase
MHGKDIVTMSQMELRRVSIINKVIDKLITQLEASKILELSTRQIQRITKRVSKEGDKGVIHRSRGKPSTRAFPEKTKDKILKLCKTKYEGFNPLFASEKLFEIERIRVSRETLRGWFKEKDIPYKTRKKRPHRAWRERRHFFGQMEQVDGSHHDWFEGRGPKCVLMGYIDDANSNVFARFHDYEGTFPFMDSFKRYIRKYGLPYSIYLDKHTTYKSTAKPSIEDELNNRESQSQVQRALSELGVEAIYANSPQAKGRVERLFRTFQDRLIKEMRLKGIKSVKDANKFLQYYLPIYNRRFKVEAIEKGDLHRPLPKGIDLDKILCRKTKRGLNKDSTVAHDKKLYLVLDKIYTKNVFVEERINGKMLITHKGKSLKYKEIARRPKKKEEKPKYIFTMVRKERARPPMDHPLKGPFFRARYRHLQQNSQKEKVAPKEKGLLLTKP